MRHDGWKLQIVKRKRRAFQITGLTWIVERSFAWLGRNRRLSKDYEYRVQTAELMIDLAAIRLMLNRLLHENFSNTLRNRNRCECSTIRYIARQSPLLNNGHLRTAI
jgi:DDE family transposase